jgi:hypothetical protein
MSLDWRLCDRIIQTALGGVVLKKGPLTRRFFEYLRFHNYFENRKKLPVTAIESDRMPEMQLPDGPLLVMNVMFAFAFVAIFLVPGIGSFCNDPPTVTQSKAYREGQYLNSSWFFQDGFRLEFQSNLDIDLSQFDRFIKVEVVHRTILNGSRKLGNRTRINMRRCEPNHGSRVSLCAEDGPWDLQGTFGEHRYIFVQLLLKPCGNGSHCAGTDESRQWWHAGIRARVSWKKVLPDSRYENLQAGESFQALMRWLPPPNPCLTHAGPDRIETVATELYFRGNRATVRDRYNPKAEKALNWLEYVGEDDNRGCQYSDRIFSLSVRLAPSSVEVHSVRYKPVQEQFGEVGGSWSLLVLMTSFGFGTFQKAFSRNRSRTRASSSSDSSGASDSSVDEEVII